MKQRLIAVALALLVTIPASAFACGPMMGHSGHTGQTGGSGKKNKGDRNVTKRQQWTKKRMQDLKGQIREYQKARQWSDNLGHATGDVAGDMSANQRRQYLTKRFEYLALKRERRGLTPDEMGEMKALQNILLKPR